MLIKTHIGVSLDGFVSDASGLAAWEYTPGLDRSQPPFGYSDFMDGVGAVVMGRTSFEQGLPDWRDAWPWGDSPIFVLTHRPLPEDAPSTVRASQGGPAGVVEQLKAAGVTKDVQLLGGPNAVEAFMQVGLLDRLGLVVLPILLGEGIPMFGFKGRRFSSSAWAASTHAPATENAWTVKLESHRVFPEGAVQVVYALK